MKIVNIYPENTSKEEFESLAYQASRLLTSIATAPLKNAPNPAILLNASNVDEVAVTCAVANG